MVTRRAALLSLASLFASPLGAKAQQVEKTVRVGLLD
jgi:hypothetical protein